MLKDEDNKYCVDCDSKGPRWASWNLGMFLCIRCAGMHRNLGVHISKVKSVNLDTWTPQQVAVGIINIINKWLMISSTGGSLNLNDQSSNASWPILLVILSVVPNSKCQTGAPH